MQPGHPPFYVRLVLDEYRMFPSSSVKVQGNGPSRLVKDSIRLASFSIISSREVGAQAIFMDKPSGLKVISD